MLWDMSLSLVVQGHQALRSILQLAHKRAVRVKPGSPLCKEPSKHRVLVELEACQRGIPNPRIAKNSETTRFRWNKYLVVASETQKTWKKNYNKKLDIQYLGLESVLFAVFFRIGRSYSMSFEATNPGQDLESVTEMLPTSDICQKESQKTHQQKT